MYKNKSVVKFDILKYFLPVNVSAQGIFPSLPCPNPKYCACPGIGNCLPIVANDELFENILLIPI